MMKIEKRPMEGMESYLVIGSGANPMAIELEKVRAIVLMWVFFAIVFLTYVLGQQSANQQVMIAAYMAQGNLTDLAGNKVDCKPMLTDQKTVEWKCENHKDAYGWSNSSN